MKTITSTCLFGCLLLFIAASNVMAVTGQARIGFSSKTVGLSAINTRPAGSSEYVEIAFIAADGTVNPSIPVTVSSSDASVIGASPAPVANALGNYILSVPANAIAGATASITASATVGGINYSRTRGFVIEESAPPPSGSSTTTRATTPTTSADQSGPSI